MFGSVIRSAPETEVSGPMPSVSAAAVVMTFMVEPGGSACCVAWLSSGLSSSFSMPCIVARRTSGSWLDSPLGSNDGLEASASTSPVEGRTAATEPTKGPWPAPRWRASYAVRCASGSRVSSTLPPCGVRPEIRPEMRCDSRRSSEPLRNESCDCSTPEVAYCSE